MKKTTIALMLGLALASPVQAEWVKYVETDNGKAYYFESGTIKKTRSGYVRVWELLDYKTPNKSAISSVKSLKEYDCDEERVGLLAIGFYSQGMGKGQALSYVGDSDVKPAWEYAPPGSVAAGLLSMFCQSR